MTIASATSTSLGSFTLGINYLAVVAASVAALVSGGLWYSPLLFGNAWIRLRGVTPGPEAGGRPPLGKVAAQFLRDLLVAYVLARFVVLLGVVDWVDAVYLGLAVGIGFQATGIVGSVIHEDYPKQLFAIHVGDALVKTVIMAIILGVWR